MDAVCVASLPPHQSSVRLSYVLGAVRQRAPEVPIVLICWNNIDDCEEQPPPDGVQSVARSLREAIDACVRLFEEPSPAIETLP